MPRRSDRKNDHVSLKGNAGRVAISNKNSGQTRERSRTEGDASGVRLDHLSKVLSRSPDSVVLKKQDVKLELNLLGSETNSTADVISPSSSSPKRALHSHEREEDQSNTSGDTTPGVLKPEIGVERGRAQTSGSGDTGQLRSEKQYVDKTAVDSLKAHNQRKFVIRNAIWDEDGDISPNGPVLLRGSHQKLRLCRSLDPNILSSKSDNQQEEVNNPQQEKNSRNRTEKPGSLKARSRIRKGKLAGSPGSSNRLMPRKLWKGKATKLAASPPYDTSQPHPAWSPLGKQCGPPPTLTCLIWNEGKE
ncbi:hypothetical protein HOLleu_29866 [Holothuria leucospilota]|uniref:Uncharacterized protein n=1 Tax=Holothuria leucospilota TaxID=206669 RepID=A0A9Q1GY02_HOLLE|nr:hypothetical protein HOLleu_29866 [Holothuria leucospilota]